MLDNDNFSGVILNDNFAQLPDEIQQKVIDQVSKRDGGFMGKFFGNKKENASMNIAVTICILLLLLCGIDIIHSICANTEFHMELISTVIPVISLSLGFIFGKGNGNAS